MRLVKVAGADVRLVKVAGADELDEGQSKILNVDGKVMVLFRVKNDYFALDNNCLHRGGPLGDGELNDYEVTCPWHGWKYDIRTGSFTIIPTLKVKKYNVRLENGSVFVEL